MDFYIDVDSPRRNIKMRTSNFKKSTINDLKA